MKSYEYIDLAKKKLNMNNLQLGEYIGVSRSAISEYKNENRQMDNYACHRIADVLGIKAIKIISLANSEREKNIEKKEFWQEKSKEYGGIENKFLELLFFITATIAIVITMFKVTETGTKKMIEKLQSSTDSLSNAPAFSELYDIALYNYFLYIENIVCILC